jgi:hypothetical protein
LVFLNKTRRLWDILSAIFEFNGQTLGC